MELRSRVLTSGGVLAVRQILGIVISLGGMLLLTRLLGAQAYGTYIAAFGIYNFLYHISQWGLNVYLVRQKESAGDEDFDQAFTLLLGVGLLFTLLVVLASPLLAAWLQIEGFRLLICVLFLSMPVALISTVPIAKAERALDFRKIAAIELAGQIVFYGTAIPLAVVQFGSWAAVAGWLVQQGVMAVALFRTTGYVPRFHWDPQAVRRMLSYGLSYSASVWIWYLRLTVNPLIVGRFAGPEAVAFVHLAIRFSEQLGFIRDATWRLSIATFAKLQDDSGRMVRAIREGMQLQLLLIGPLQLGFVIIGPWFLMLIYDPKWLAVIDIFPFIAAGFLVNTSFNLHISALYVRRNNAKVALFHFVHVVLFAGGALVLVPRYGILGYGMAELVAMLSYGLIGYFTVRRIGAVSYRFAAPLLAATCLCLFYRYLGSWTFGSILALALWPETWRSLNELYGNLRPLILGFIVRSKTAT